MKGTIRRRVNKDGATSYVCQVKAGSDPATGKQRVLPGTAKSERAAHKLVHELVTRAASGEVQAADVTLNELIDRWLELGGPAGLGRGQRGRAGLTPERAEAGGARP